MEGDEYQEGLGIELDSRGGRIGDGTGVSVGAGEVARCGGVVHARMVSKGSWGGGGGFRVTRGVVVRGGVANLGRGTGGGSEMAATPLFPVEEGRRRLPRVVLQNGKSTGGCL